MRKTILPYVVWLAILIALVLLFHPKGVLAEPLVQLVAEGATLTLYTDKCELAEITNLPYKARWVEKDKEYEGCWTARPDFGVVVAYFSDKTAVAIPIGGAFKKVVGT